MKDFDNIRQEDSNLREAIRRQEMSRPQMPTDLNERLMQKMNKATQRKPVHIMWPWLAAACVAGVIVMFCLPKEQTANEETQIAVNKPQNKPTKTEKQMVEQQEEPVTTIQQPSISNEHKPATKTIPTIEKTLIAEAKVAKEEPKEEPQENSSIENAENAIKSIVLTERDIPITRPENLKYTPEELEILKKQAEEAHKKWIELELEIAQYNLEQTALLINKEK